MSSPAEVAPSFKNASTVVGEVGVSSVGSRCHEPLTSNEASIVTKSSVKNSARHIDIF